MNDIDIAKKLVAHVEKLRQCRLCPRMYPPVVSGGPVASNVFLVGQAPGDKEPTGASPWHRKEPGKSLLKRALRLIVKHPAFNFS